MGALLTLLYGLLAYGACLAALLYLIGFSANLLVPKSVDVGTALPLAEALFVNILLLALFALQHSIMARKGFKRGWTRVVPPAIERSTYVLAASGTLALLFWLWSPIPAPLIWRATHPLAIQALWSVFWLGWVMVLVSTFLINHFELFGLRQVFAYFANREVPAPQFATPLLYRYVRHPLYLGLSLSLWAVPEMTAGHLLYSAALSSYLILGIWFEERDLIADFGDRYRRYRMEVGPLLPRQVYSWLRVPTGSWLRGWTNKPRNDL